MGLLGMLNMIITIRYVLPKCKRAGLLGMLNMIITIPFRAIQSHHFCLLGMLNMIITILLIKRLIAVLLFARYAKYDNYYTRL